MVRLEEAREAARLVEGGGRPLAGAGPVPGSRSGPCRPPAHASAWSRAGAGPILHWVLTGPSRRGTRPGQGQVDPSFVNWPALEYAVLKNIVPDFPLCNKSFNLSYSGNDL